MSSVCGAARWVAILVGGALTLTAGNARADEPSSPPAAVDKHSPPPPVTTPVPQPGPRDPSQASWGGYLGVSGSANRAAMAVQLGLRRRVSTHWTFGLDGEWNPWFAFSGPTPVRNGVVNMYGTAILRLPLAYEDFNLRTAVSVGASYLLIDLYGAPQGSVGPYFGVSPLGLEWKLSRLFLLIINPLSFSLPVPKITGVPLWFPQYRFTIGLGILAG
jgi:hypothetical protein